VKFIGRLLLCGLMTVALTVAIVRAALANTPIQNTAIAALKAAYDKPNGTVYEHGGMIVENSGALRWVEPHPDNASRDSVYAVDRKMLAKGDVMVGTYHTHPCMTDYYVPYFSTADVILAYFTAVPAFILDECTGDVHEFFSLVDEIHDTGDDLPVRGANCKRIIRHLPTGRIVGNIGEHDVEHDNPDKDDCP
jgi:proteasome lid subunit RPN8/RPN11